jgi:hypothetical protein
MLIHLGQFAKDFSRPDKGTGAFDLEAEKGTGTRSYDGSLVPLTSLQFLFESGYANGAFIDRLVQASAELGIFFDSRLPLPMEFFQSRLIVARIHRQLVSNNRAFFLLGFVFGAKLLKLESCRAQLALSLLQIETRSVRFQLNAHVIEIAKCPAVNQLGALDGDACRRRFDLSAVFDVALEVFDLFFGDGNAGLLRAQLRRLNFDGAGHFSAKSGGSRFQFPLFFFIGMSQRFKLSLGVGQARARPGDLDFKAG